MPTKNLKNEHIPLTYVYIWYENYKSPTPQKIRFFSSAVLGVFTYFDIAKKPYLKSLNPF